MDEGEGLQFRDDCVAFCVGKIVPAYKLAHHWMTLHGTEEAQFLGVLASPIPLVPKLDRHQLAGSSVCGFVHNGVLSRGDSLLDLKVAVCRDGVCDLLSHSLSHALARVRLPWVH